MKWATFRWSILFGELQCDGIALKRPLAYVEHFLYKIFNPQFQQMHHLQKTRSFQLLPSQ